MSKQSQSNMKENAPGFPAFTRTEFVAVANGLKAKRQDFWSNETADETMNLLVALAIAVVNWAIDVQFVRQDLTQEVETLDDGARRHNTHVGT